MQLCWLNVWLALEGRPHAVWLSMATAAASMFQWTWVHCMAPALSVQGVVVLVAVVAAGSRLVVTMFAIIANSRATSC